MLPPSVLQILRYPVKSTAALRKLVKPAELRRLQRADLIVVSYRKSGRTWLRAMLSHLLHQRFGVPETELVDFDNFRKHDTRAPVILLTHDDSDKPWNRWPRRATWTFRDKRIVLLVRDPRDVVVSQYFEIAKRTDPATRAQLVKADGQLRSMADFVLGEELERVIAFMNRWARQLPHLPQTLLLTYEGMRQEPAAALGAVAALLGQEFSAADVAVAVEFARFESLKSKERAGFFTSERLRPGNLRDEDSFKVRRGKVGGYQDYFTPSETAQIDALVTATLDPAYAYNRDRSPRDGGPDPAVV